MSDISTFKTRYTEFNGIDDEVVGTILEECKTLLSEKNTGKKYQILLFLLVAHELSLINEDSDGTVEIAKSINGGSVSLKNVATNEYTLYYSKTKYGLKYLAMKKTVRFVGAVLCE